MAITIQSIMRLETDGAAFVVAFNDLVQQESADPKVMAVANAANAFLADLGMAPIMLHK